MKVNHDKTKNKILDITAVLKEQAQYAKDYKQNQIDITSDETYSQEYKKTKLAEMMSSYMAKYKETKEKVIMLLNDIVLIEDEQEAILDLDVPELSNTLAIINSANGKLPAGTIKSIKLKFAGQYQVLLTIQRIFENYGIDLKPHNYEEYTTKAAVEIQSLIQDAENIEEEETSTIVSLHNLFDKVIRFGEVRGIQFDDDSKTFGDELLNSARETIARKAMGLPVNK